MRITRAIAAAALTLGLTAALAPAAQAAPVNHVRAAETSVQIAATKAKTKLTIKAPASVTAGATIKVTGKLTHKTKKGYRPYAKKTVDLVWLDADELPIVAEAKTNSKGEYTFKFATLEEEVGLEYHLLTWFPGDKSNKQAESKIVAVEATE